MANLKISQLTNGNPAQAADQIPINRAGSNFSITAGSIGATLVTWDVIQSAAAAALTLNNAGFATTFNQTSAVSWTWANTTTATVSTTNASPNIVLGANYWTGSASAADTWTLGSSLAAGSNAASTLTLVHAGSTNTAPQILFKTGATTVGSLTLSTVGQSALQLHAANTNGQLQLFGNMSTLASIGLSLGGASAFAAVTGSTQTSVAVSGVFAPASGAVNFVGLLIDSTCNQTGSASGNFIGLQVNPTQTSVGGVVLLADFQNSGTSVFQVTTDGVSFPNSGVLIDNTNSTGGANCVLTAGASGGNVVWDTAGVSVGPLTPTSMTTVKGLVTAFTGTSDARLKEYAPYEGGLDQILAISPAKYTWNEKGQKHTGISGGQEFVGFIAQDVQKAIPEAITALEPSKDGTERYLSLDDRPIIAALVNAVKTLESRIRELEARQ